MPVERAAGGTSLIDVLDRVLDKGIVIDAWVRVSLVGIDLITVEARVVVASIDTYLKYSEAVGAATTASRPAMETKPYEEVVAENAALRAQLRVASLPAALLAAAGATPSARLSATGRRGTRANGASRGRRVAAGDDADLLAARVRLLEGFVSRTRDRRLRAATRCSGSARCSASASRSAWSGPTASRRCSPSASHGLRAADDRVVHRVARRLEQPARHARSTTGEPAFFRAVAFRRRSAAAGPRRRSRTRRFTSCRSASPGFVRRSVRPAAARRRRRTSSPELRWFTTVFGQKLDQILRQQALAEGDRKQGRERSLLYSIINAVTDPILLTDTEGRLLIANARAVTLFAASEEESEGRRGAVAHEQHAVVVGAVEQGDRGDRRDAARAAARQSGRRLGPAVRAAQHDHRGSARRAPASSRFCATSPTCGARARRSRRTTASCASPRRRRAPRAIA